MKPAGHRRPCRRWRRPRRSSTMRRDESPAAVPAPYSISDMALPPMVAPPEVTGDGALVPGRRHRPRPERAGRRPRVPPRWPRNSSARRIGCRTSKCLFIDTDSETLHSATQPGPGALEPAGSDPRPPEPPGPLPEAAAQRPQPDRRLVRPADALQDPAQPRDRRACGSLGRLAFLDHYRVVRRKAGRVHRDAAPTRTPSPRPTGPRGWVCARTARGSTSSPGWAAAPAAACSSTPPIRRGTSSGRWATPIAEIIGVFLLPPAERGAKGPRSINAYTALRELNHFSQPETIFTASTTKSATAR